MALRRYFIFRFLRKRPAAPTASNVNMEGSGTGESATAQPVCGEPKSKFSSGEPMLPGVESKLTLVSTYPLNVVLLEVVSTLDAFSSALASTKYPNTHNASMATVRTFNIAIFMAVIFSVTGLDCNSILMKGFYWADDIIFLPSSAH